MHSFKANCRCTPIANLQDFMGRFEISSGPAALLSFSESMTEQIFFLVTVLIVNSVILSLSGYLTAISKPLKTPRLANDLFRQLTILFGSLEISPLSNLISSTLTILSFGLVFCLMNFHCSLLVGSFWKKLMQKLLCASLSLLLTRFLLLSLLLTKGIFSP